MHIPWNFESTTNGEDDQRMSGRKIRKERFLFFYVKRKKVNKIKGFLFILFLKFLQLLMLLFDIFLADNFKIFQLIVNQ